MSEGKGILLALITAIVSGFSIFLNSFIVSGLNASVFTFAKNLIVAVFLVSAILLLSEFSNLKKLKFKSWLQLSAIGFVGGSIPFLLFFNALKMTSAVNASFIHKTLFIWVSVLALIFLKEKLDRRFLFSAALLFAGVAFLSISVSSFGIADLMILAATLLWAVENTISKHVLHSLSSRTVAFGRMFFGSIFIAVYLISTNEIFLFLNLNLTNIYWILISSMLLFLYVSFWYAGLKHARASVATSVLLLGAPITAILNTVFLGKALSLYEAVGFVLILLGIIAMIGFAYLASRLNWKNLTIARSKTNL